MPRVEENSATGSTARTTHDALERRLSEQLNFDESKQRILETLLAENEDLRKQNISLEMENRRLQHTLDLDSRRHKELPTEEVFSDTYDWIVDIQLLSDVSKQGWKVEFSGQFFDGLDERERSKFISDGDWQGEDGSICTDGLGHPPTVGWHGAVVAVLGLYDKGKTFVLNNLTETKLPSGKKVATKGLSFKHVQVEGGTKFVLLDSEGSYSPVKVSNELSVVEKEATELFLQVPCSM